MKQQDSTGMANGANPGAPAAEEHITLSQAAKLAPGRPSSNCVWRWCREGVKAASGTRVRLGRLRPRDPPEPDHHRRRRDRPRPRAHPRARRDLPRPSR